MEKKNQSVPSSSAGANSSTSGSLPVGSIVAFYGSNPPFGWVLCDGRGVDTNKYPEAVSCGISSVPDLIGRVPVGLDRTSGSLNYLGGTGGENTVTLSLDQIPPHAHTVAFYEWTTSQGGGSGSASNLLKTGSFISTGDSGGGQAHNNMQPYCVVNYIIYLGSPAS